MSDCKQKIIFAEKIRQEFIHFTCSNKLLTANKLHNLKIVFVTRCKNFCGVQITEQAILKCENGGKAVLQGNAADYCVKCTLRVTAKQKKVFLRQGL